MYLPIISFYNIIQYCKYTKANDRDSVNVLRKEGKSSEKEYTVLVKISRTKQNHVMIIVQCLKRH